MTLGLKLYTPGTVSGAKVRNCQIQYHNSISMYCITYLVYWRKKINRILRWEEFYNNTRFIFAQNLRTNYNTAKGQSLKFFFVYEQTFAVYVVYNIAASVARLANCILLHAFSRTAVASLFVRAFPIPATDNMLTRKNLRRNSKF